MSLSARTYAFATLALAWFAFAVHNAFQGGLTTTETLVVGSAILAGLGGFAASYGMIRHRAQPILGWAMVISGVLVLTFPYGAVQ